MPVQLAHRWIKNITSRRQIRRQTLVLYPVFLRRNGLIHGIKCRDNREFFLLKKRILIRGQSGKTNQLSVRIFHLKKSAFV